MADFKTTIREEITLDDVKRVYEHVELITGINWVSERTMPIPTSEVNIFSFGTAVGAGTFNEADVRYIRLTNKDATNFIQIIIADENSAESAHKLEAGKSMYIMASAEGVVNVHDASASALTVSFGDITTLTALANTGECSLQYVVASV
jgi:hypothetical protein